VDRLYGLRGLRRCLRKIRGVYVAAAVQSYHAARGGANASGSRSSPAAYWDLTAVFDTDKPTTTAHDGVAGCVARGRLGSGRAATSASDWP